MNLEELLRINTLQKLDGTELAAQELKGKAILFVNVASRCGLTPQYEGLVQLQESHMNSGLVVVGVPCNQFGAQEPGTAEEIQQFCSANYGVTFPMLEKQDVNGDNRSPLYRWLVGSNVGQGNDIGWNFAKFLVDKNGQVVERFAPSTSPADAQLLTAIKAVL